MTTRLPAAALAAALGAAPACAPADTPSPYELPPHDGCTAIQEVRVESSPLSGTYTWTWHDEDDLARYHEDVYGVEREQVWTRDADGCVTEYAETVIDGDDTLVHSVTTVCEDGLPVSETERWVYNGFEAYDPEEWTYTHVVEDGKPTLVVRARASGGVERIAQTWAGGELVVLDRWWNQAWRRHETWTFDGAGRVLNYVYEDVHTPSNNERDTYVRDEHGRYLEWRHGDGADYDVDTYVETRTWQEDIFEPRRIEHDYGADGSVEVVQEWDCTDTWPWSCEIDIDIAGGDVPDSPEQTSDYTWTCP